MTQQLKTQIEQTPILPNSLAIWGLGQMGVAIKGPEGVLYIDACLTDVVREEFGEFWVRGYPPPILPEAASHVSYYLISHEHLDHLDPKTIGPISKASPKAKFVTTGWCKDLLADLDIADDRTIFPPILQPTVLPGTTCRVTPVPAAHYGKDFDEQKGYRWLGFIIEWNGVVFYHGGDTLVYPGYIEMLKGLPRADVAMIALNGRDYFRELVGVLGNFMPMEAAHLAQELGWDVVIPGHNDLFPNNAIPFGHIIEAFENVTPRQKLKILQPGELYYYVK
ncbi:MAG: MBL fold metallo-hydrolase [Chloroflexi bacterium]|nr:MBL fold metallo-hydrolase [Chloroflexota bacterium]